MSDETSSPPAATTEPSIVIDSENVVHDAERTSRHGLSHLEGDFVAEFKKLAAYTDTEAKALLAWVAAKL